MNMSTCQLMPTEIIIALKHTCKNKDMNTDIHIKTYKNTLFKGTNTQTQKVRL